MGSRTRLRAVDTLWLDVEKPGPSIAIGAVNVVEGPAPSIEEFREFVGSRIDRIPRLQERLARPTLSVRRPTWQTTAIDLAHHIQHVDLGGDADIAALEATVSQIMERPLDFERPLWLVHLVTGLADGRYALVNRMHHAVTDGHGSVLTLGHLLDVDPHGSQSLAEAAATQGMAARGAAPRRSVPAAALRLGISVGRGVLAASTHPRESIASVLAQLERTSAGVLAFASPRRGSIVGGDPGLRRHWRTLHIPLADVKAIKNRLGGTVNDVVMTLVSGGYSRMLESTGPPLDGKYLKVLIPVSVRPPGNLEARNLVTGLFVKLPLSGSPLERYEWVRSHVNTVKDAKTAPALKLIFDGLNLIPGRLQSKAFAVSGPFPEWTLDTLVTNVLGPTSPVYSMGRRVEHMMPIVALGTPLRCSVAVVSYDGTLTITISTGEGLDEAGADLRQGITATLASLQDAADSLSSHPSRGAA
jgi:diacylglycerol O-acyltransferase